MKLICGCGKANHKAKLLDLKDIRGFTKRKILTCVCSQCHNVVLTLSETRIEDGKVFINENIYGKRAVNILIRESKNILDNTSIGNIGNVKWCYGDNVQIKNRKGKVVKIRQYSKDFSTGKRTLEKEIKVK